MHNAPQSVQADCWCCLLNCLKVRRNLHIVLSFSPVGDAFRERLRKFPSLVNCTSIDWFTAWPKDALANVATNMLAGLPGVEDAVSTFSDSGCLEYDAMKCRLFIAASCKSLICGSIAGFFQSSHPSFC